MAGGAGASGRVGSEVAAVVGASARGPGEPREAERRGPWAVAVGGCAGHPGALISSPSGCYKPVGWGQGPPWKLEPRRGRVVMFRVCFEGRVVAG